ncbi:uncharacterized protein LOC130645990 [Hydractinia symbiolongicarpus]|uniref:uncharacterized protein LOC130645990 n=1 Tax=Hydractinia symbiolongicarpus TaxID=13093 RepID=UPI00254E664B|nr:uncharacterized protein LOC130645990 [Hydractinia symbiolongicarpus]
MGDLFDVITVAETKLDSSFPSSQFVTDGYSNPYRLDISANRGGLFTFVKSDIPSRRLEQFILNPNIQVTIVELRLRKQKWLVCKALDFYNYDNILINGDFNLDPADTDLGEFLLTHSLYNHMKEKTCRKSSSGSCIDFILSNRKHSLMHTGAAVTGLSDYHSLVYTMLKTQYVKLPPLKISYRCYKNFDETYFLEDISRSMTNISNYDDFHSIFTSLLDRHAPLKTKFLRANNRPHVSKTLRKAIMKRLRLKRVANTSGKDDDVRAFKKQRNLVVNINRQDKKTFFSNFGRSNMSKGFWKSVKPLFNEKAKYGKERITLVDKDILYNNDTLSSECDAVLAAVEKYASHPSVLFIKSKKQIHTFELSPICEDVMFKEILALDDSKKVSGSIPTKIPVFHLLSLAEIIPLYKKGSSTDKVNYRPVSLLPTVSKVFERILAKQLLPFFNTFLSKYLCGFRKSYSCQYAILNMLQKWQKCLSISGKVGAVLMDLSKAFDCLPFGLLIAKLEAYGVGYNTLKLSYLSNRKHRVRLGSSRVLSATLPTTTPSLVVKVALLLF